MTVTTPPRPRKICVVTGSRAEYGILSRLMKEIDAHPDAELQVVATNMHLSPEFGLTYREIEADGFRIDRKVEMLLSTDTATGIVKSMGVGMIGFADTFRELAPDIIVILGDRYEMLAVASAAAVMGIPIAHLHGGEITEGAIDDNLRHAITKLSYLHFTSTEEYRRRVIQMGEAPERVFCTGALGVDNILNEPILSLPELEEQLGFRLGEDYIVATYHPVTREPGMAETHIKALLSALETVTDRFRILFTLPNSDADGRAISAAINEWCALRPDKAIAVKSLGRKRFYTAMRHASAMIGNSSSGLIEAPSFRIPTLNIGDRQKGRARGNTIVDCAPDRQSIIEGLRQTLSPAFLAQTRADALNPYHHPDTLRSILTPILRTPLAPHPPKPFHNLPS